MKKLILLATCFVILLFSVVIFAQDDNIYWDTQYEYPEPNVMVSDIKIGYYYGTGQYYYVSSGEMLNPVTSADYLTRYLTILHNSDGESALTGSSESGSIAQFATIVKNLKKESGAENTLIVSSGDNFLAGVSYAASEGVLDAKALNMIGYDVTAIGNHEFDFGQNGLKKFLDTAKFAFVSSNLVIDRDSVLYSYTDNKIFRATVIDRAGRNIGIVGATTDELKYISSPGESVHAEDVKQYLQQAVDSLRNRGLNVIIVLSHLQNVEEEKKLAKMIDGADIFIAGGGDDLLGNENNEYLVRSNGETDQPIGEYPYETTSLSGEPVLVVATDGQYDYVGRLTVLFDEKGLVSRVDLLNSGPVPVKPDTEPDAQIQSQIVEQLEKNIEALKTQVIGKTLTALDGTRELVRTRETAMGNAITDGYMYVAEKAYDGDVDFAFTNGGGIRNDVKIEANGDITKYHVINALPFNNYLTVVKGLTAQDIKAMFERAVENVPGQGGQFLQVSKDINVVFDSSKEVGNRVQSITIYNYRTMGDLTIYADGSYIGTDLTFSVLTNNFTADGGDNYPMLAAIPMTSKINIGYSYAQGFEIYIKEKSPISVEVGNRLVDING